MNTPDNIDDGQCSTDGAQLRARLLGLIKLSDKRLEDIARDLGVRQETVGKYLSGKIPLDTDRLAGILRSIGAQLKDLGGPVILRGDRLVLRKIGDGSTDKLMTAGGGLRGPKLRWDAQRLVDEGMAVITDGALTLTEAGQAMLEKTSTHQEHEEQADER